MQTWYIPAGVIAGVSVAIVTALVIAARELGDWRAIRLQFILNNRNHSQRRLKHD